MSSSNPNTLVRVTQGERQHVQILPLAFSCHYLQSSQAHARISIPDSQWDYGISQSTVTLS
jgi:hypothetical protein